MSIYSVRVDEEHLQIGVAASSDLLRPKKYKEPFTIKVTHDFKMGIGGTAYLIFWLARSDTSALTEFRANNYIIANNFTSTWAGYTPWLTAEWPYNLEADLKIHLIVAIRAATLPGYNTGDNIWVSSYYYNAFLSKPAVGEFSSFTITPT